MHGAQLTAIRASRVRVTVPPWHMRESRCAVPVRDGACGRPEHLIGVSLCGYDP